MKSLQNISYKTLFTILFLSLAGIVFFLKIGGKTQKVSAAWWDEMWHYRKAINISSHTSSESNVYIIATVNIGTTTKAQADDGDFRFITQSGENLNYYIASGVGTTTISFHILIPSFPAGAQTIYAYYGNPSASNGFSTSAFSTHASNYTIGSLSTEEIGGGPIVYWKFDEGVGTTAYDSAGNNNGVINKASWTNQGKTNNGLGFSPNQENTIIDYKVWKVGQTGTVTGFSSNGAADENYRVFSTDPWGRKVVVWEARTDVASDADGGWDGSNFSIDNTKLYRFSVWVNRTITGNGSFYLGTHGYGSINGIYNRSTGTPSTNPYFWSGTPSQGVWTLIVGHIWPILSGTGAQHSDSGRYTISGGKIGSISSDYVWREETTTSHHRSYLYYSTNTDTRQQWIYPRVDIVDGTEPSIQDLLNGFDSYGSDMSATITGPKESFSFWYDKNSTGNWQHIAKSSSNYYINGKLGTPDEYPIYVSGDDIFVGRTTDSDFATGSIDEVKIFNYTLTADQIKQDYNSRGSISGSSVNLGVRSNTAPSLKSSLVAYYKFDENNGTTVYDSSGNNNTATMGSGSSSPSWSIGKVNNSLNFDSNDYVTLPNDLGYTTTVSAFAWLKTNGTPVGGYHIVFGGSQLEISIPTSGQVRTGINTDTRYVSNHGSGVTDGKWHYIGFTFDGSTKKTYIDGQFVGEQTGIEGTLVSSFSNRTLGKLGSSSAYFLNGYLDEVKIYNRALTPEEVKQDYNQGSVVQFGSTNQTIGGTTTSLEYCIPGDTSPCSPPVAEWKMDEGTGTSIVDTSGNNYTSTYVGSPTKTQGKIGQAISFNGTNNGISLNGPPTYSKETLSAWVYIDSSSPSGDIVGNCHTNSNAYGFSLYLDGNTLRAKAETNAKTYFYDNVTYDVSSLKNKWIHLTMSWENLGTGTSGCDATAKLYVNGQMVSVGTTNFSGGYDCTKPYQYPFSMGGTTQNSLIRLTKVKLDQVRVYNYIRTPAQIAYDYNKGGPVGWWKFDECQGNIAYDWSGIGNTGVINIGTSGTQNSLGTCAVGTSAAWTNGAVGKVNSSLSFDGIDDYLQINEIGTTGNTPISLSLWANFRSNSSGDDVFIIYGKDGTTYQCAGLYLRSSDNYVRFTGWSGSTVDYSTGFIKDYNVWHHWTLVYNGSTVLIYRDGIPDPVGSQSRSLNFTLKKLLIGGGAASGNYTDTKIDDVRIYNYALTAEQVKQVYNGGAVNFR